MRPLSRSLSAVLLVGCLATAVALAGELKCDGPYKGLTLTAEELATVLLKHKAWLESGRQEKDERKANLCQADLIRADLPGANLTRANLRGAQLAVADFHGATLTGANLQEASLTSANLHGAGLTEAELHNADLGEANLQGASLMGAILEEASLEEADLEEADLTDANLQGTFFMRANLAKAIYEPNPEKLPALWTLTDPDNNLEKLAFLNSPAALIALREAFKKAGMRTQERQITYAIEHTRQLKAWNPSWYFSGQDRRPWLEQLAGKGESLFSYILFELPSGYGMVPSRALATLSLFILVFSLVYMGAFLMARGRAGIWVKHGHDRLCWLIRNRVVTQSCVERFKDRDIAHIPVVTRTLMALEIGSHKLLNRTNRGHVYCPGLRLPRWRFYRRVMMPRPCSTPLSLKGNVSALVRRLLPPKMARLYHVSVFSDDYGPTVNGTSIISPMIVDVPGFVRAPIQR